MYFFFDTAEFDEISRWQTAGLVDGITTNLSMIAKLGKLPLEVAQELATICEGPISIPVSSIDSDAMINDARDLAAVAKNIVIKLPATIDGLHAARLLVAEGIKCNITFIFQPATAIPFLRLKPDFISVILDRQEDFGAMAITPAEIVTCVHTLVRLLSPDTQIIAASIRHPDTFSQVCAAEPHIITIPPSTWNQVLSHPLTKAEAESAVQQLQKRLSHAT